MGVDMVHDIWFGLIRLCVREMYASKRLVGGHMGEVGMRYR